MARDRIEPERWVSGGGRRGRRVDHGGKGAVVL